MLTYGGALNGWAVICGLDPIVGDQCQSRDPIVGDQGLSVGLPASLNLVVHDYASRKTILLKEYILIPHDRIATLSRGTQAGWKAGPRRQSGATTAAGCDHARPFSLCSVSGS